MRNADQNKYDDLMKGLKTQYSLGNNQYCDKLSEVKDVLSTYTWGKKYHDMQKKKKDQSKSSNNVSKSKKEEEKSFNQSGKAKKPRFFCVQRQTLDTEL